MKIVDAGVIVELLVGGLDPEILGPDEIAVPHLLDSEVLNAMRRLVASGVLSDAEGTTAVEGFLALHLTRYPADWLRPRMWQLRHNVSAYDATYLALAELTDARCLVTTDARLAKAPGSTCRVELLPQRGSN